MLYTAFDVTNENHQLRVRVIATESVRDETFADRVTHLAAGQLEIAAHPADFDAQTLETHLRYVAAHRRYYGRVGCLV